MGPYYLIVTVTAKPLDTPMGLHLISWSITRWMALQPGWSENSGAAVHMPMSLPHKDSYRLGVISDTHGYLPLRALRVFQGVDVILHAGDIGSQEILRSAGAGAPVLAVRGNMDGGSWADRLAEYEFLQAGDHLIHLIHDRLRLRPRRRSGRLPGGGQRPHPPPFGGKKRTACCTSIPAAPVPHAAESSRAWRVIRVVGDCRREWR